MTHAPGEFEFLALKRKREKLVVMNMHILYMQSNILHKHRKKVIRYLKKKKKIKLYKFPILRIFYRGLKVLMILYISDANHAHSVTIGNFFKIRRQYIWAYSIKVTFPLF